MAHHHSLIVVVCAIAGPAALGQEANFETLPPLDENLPEMRTTGISRDGTAVVGWGSVPRLDSEPAKCDKGCWEEEEAHGAVWTDELLTEYLGFDEANECCPESEPPRGATPYSISPDGAVVSGYARGYYSSTRGPALWFSATEPVRIPTPEDMTWVYLTAVTDGGSVAAGYASTAVGHRAVVSVGGAELVHLTPDLPEGEASQAAAISDDGNVIVGTVDAYGHRWERLDGAWTAEPLTSGSELSTAWDVTGDGRIVLAWIRFEDGTSTIARFMDDGSREAIPESDGHSPRSISDDGALILATGSLDGGPSDEFLIWHEATGWRSLATALTDAGAAVPWPLIEDPSGRDSAMSGDGTTFAAVTDDRAWKAHLPPANPDTDGDGLLDAWERDGIDVDNDGTIDLDLPAMGAKPDHKTLFLEIDEMECSSVDPEVLARVKAAFANAEMVENPDGEPGIDLIIVVDERDLPCFEEWEIPEDEYWPRDFDVQKDLYFGTPQERVHPARDALLAAKRKIFRYCIYANTFPDGTLGVTRDFYANDFIIAQGEFREDNLCPGQGCDLIAYEAATFMHELGHCLGLFHGGGDAINYKPNYISVMNYLKGFPFRLGGSTWRLDYSQGNMLPLDESNLDEEVGFHDITGRNQGIVTYFSRVGCVEACDVEEQQGIDVRARLLRNGQWVDFDGDGGFDQGVCADLNYHGAFIPGAEQPTPCDMMNDHNDWLALELPLVEESANPGAGGTGVPGELTAETLRTLHDLLPTPCPADVDTNRTVDFNDLLAVLALWGDTTGHPADITADGVVDFDDVLALLQAWGPCE